MAEAERRIKLYVHGDKGLKDFLEDHAPRLKVDIYNDRIELLGSGHNTTKAIKMFKDLSLDPYRRNLMLSETEPLRYLNIKLEDEVCYLVKDDKKVYACIPHPKGKQTKAILEIVNNLISKYILVHTFDKISDDLNTEIVDLVVSHHSKITVLEDAVLVYTADIKRYVDDVIAGHSTGQHSDDNTRPHVYEIPIDEGGKLFIERHCPGVSVHPSDTGFSLLGKRLRTEKKMIEIVDLDVDNRKLALITAERKARDFLNKELASNRILCYILVPTSLVGIMIPGLQYDVGRIKSVIENNVCVETVNEEDSEMLIEFAGKAACLIEGDNVFLIYTKDIEAEVHLYLRKPDKSVQGDLAEHKIHDNPLKPQATNNSLILMGVQIFHHTSAVIGDDVIRHLSQDKIDSFIVCFNEPELAAEFTGEFVKITCPYERKGDLYKTLQTELGNLDKSIFYIRNVTPEIHHLIQLYLKKSRGIRRKHVMYLKGGQIELKIVQKWIKDPMVLYDDVREKGKAFQHYQCDTMDVCKATESVSDKVREFNETGEPKFDNILVETDNDDKMIKIHYPASEHESPFEVKNWFNVRLKLVKTKGMQNQFDGRRVLQPGMQQAEKKDRKLDINPKRIPLDTTHRSMSTYASSSVCDPDSYKPYTSTSKCEENVHRKDSLDLRPSRHGEMASQRSGTSNVGSNISDMESSGYRDNASQSRETSNTGRGMNSNMVAGRMPVKTSDINDSSDLASSRIGEIVSQSPGTSITGRGMTSDMVAGRMTVETSDINNSSDSASSINREMTSQSPETSKTGRGMNSDMVAGRMTVETSDRNDSSDLASSRIGEMTSQSLCTSYTWDGSQRLDIEISGRIGNPIKRPQKSDMESSGYKGNPSLRSQKSHSTSGTHSLSTRSRELDVKSCKSGADDEGVTGTVYCTETNLVIKVYEGNIIHLDVDCIVNAADGDLSHGAGVAGAISRAAGRDFDTQSREYIEDNGRLDVGQCISTGAGRLKYKFVLHAVGPQWHMYKDKADCEHDLMKTIYNTLRRAELLKMKSVALPSISSGIFEVPWDVCAQQYARGIERFEEESSGYLQEVHFVDINEKMLKTIRSVFSLMFKVKTSHVDEQF